MIGKKSISERTFDIFNIVFLIFLMVISAYPLLYVLFASLSDPLKLMQNQGFLLKPLGFTLKGYELVLSNPNIIRGFANTVFYVVVGTCINIFFTSMSAYVLSRKNLLWGRALMIMVTITMFFSGGLIPFYLLVDKLGLINTRWAIIIPGAISVWNLIVMRTSFMGIPDSLEESARIDGANDFTILFRIILPLSKATLAVMALFYAVGQWNSWFNAMIFLRDRSKYPLALILREILISHDMKDMATAGAKGQFLKDDAYKSLVQYCTVIVATVPILFVYPFLQKHFVKGVMIGSIKG